MDEQIRAEPTGLVAWLRGPPRPAAAPPTPGFDRACIWFLAADWIVFGSMHFALPAETRAMLPPWVPWKATVVLASGLLEVTAGLLVCYGPTRRIGALLSLALLVAFIPAVIHILQEPQALPRPPDHWQSLAWRVLGVPHNLLMAICSLHLIGKPWPDPWAAPPAPRPPAFRSGAVLVVAGVLLLCNAAGFLAVVLGVPAARPTAYLWMMMCLAVGGLVGFLFAVPRANRDAGSRRPLLPNRNIEAVSDWLTKILVGLGLVNLGEIRRFLATTSARLATVFGLPDNPDYVLAFLVYFAVAGFLEGYLLTRMFLQWQFEATGEEAMPAPGTAPGRGAADDPAAGARPAAGEAPAG
ncbi:hypothetical protein E2C05_31465, partial [Paracraurococcus ruber]